MINSITGNHLLQYKQNIFSQNGEDGIIEQIFNVIGTQSNQCCEFGAWDGIHLSNCRNLTINGWRSLYIKGDKEKFKALQDTYKNNQNVKCICRYVDTGENRLSNILQETSFNDLDFLSIDIDGLDYEIFKDLDVSPRVICIEINAGHSPKLQEFLPTATAQNNVGQPFQCFIDIAKEKGYGLACYSGNAFFIRNDVLQSAPLEMLSAEIAYEEFIASLTIMQKEWLYLVNKGLVPPYYRYRNPYLLAQNLGIHCTRTVILKLNAQIIRAKVNLPNQLGRLMHKNVA